MPKEKDVVIIGSGMGGLSSALILLKLGYNVTVIEKNREPGGMMRSYRRSGIDCPVGVHYIGSLERGQPLRRIFEYFGIFDKLPLEKMGTAGPIDRYIFDDFTFDLPSGIDAFENNLRSAFPDEQKQISSIISSMKRIADMIISFALPFGSRENSSIFSSIELFNSMGDFLNEIDCSGKLRNVLGVACSWLGLRLNDCPVFLYYNVLLSYLFSSWRIKPGAAEIADIFVERIMELGGRIILHNEVEKILIGDRTAKGVKLKSGETIEGETVIAAVHPKTMLKILPDDSIKPAYIKRVSSIEDTDGVFSAHYILNAKTHAELPYNIFRLKTDKDGVLSKGAFYQLRKTAKQDMNLLSIITNDKFENWREWENTKSGQRGSEYILKKEKKASELLDMASAFLGPLDGVKMLDAYTPLTIRDWVESPNGSKYGIMRSKDQLIKTASLNRTSVKGLFLAGQNVLAPGILGTAMGSLMTVRDIVGIEIFKSEVFNRI